MAPKTPDQPRKDAEGEAVEGERQTTEKGYEIPVPKRDDFFGNLEKVGRQPK